jgi:nucleotide-binding universal stress UspA family protein
MPPTTQHILVPLDGSEVGERALPHAAQLARLFGARVTLARVVEPLPLPHAEAGAWSVHGAHSVPSVAEVADYLAELSRHTVLDGLAVDVSTPIYPVAAGLLEAVETLGVDLIVMTTHGHTGFTRLLMGSVADKLIRHAAAPVYVVPVSADPVRVPPLRRLVVPLDGSPTAEVALGPAVALAGQARAQLDLLSIPVLPATTMVAPEAAGWNPEILRSMADKSGTYLAELATRVTAETGLRVATSVDPVSTGNVAEGIVSHVRRVTGDAVVMATHGRGGVSRWLLGSMTDHVLRITERPVWVVRTKA